MTMTRTTFFSLGVFTAMGLMLLAQTVDSVGRNAASTEAPAAHSVVAATADTAATTLDDLPAMPDPAATAVEDLASWPIAATR